MVDGWYEFWRIIVSGGRTFVEVLRPAGCLESDKIADDAGISYGSVRR